MRCGQTKPDTCTFAPSSRSANVSADCCAKAAPGRNASNRQSSAFLMPPSRPCFAAGEEGEALEQVHILLVLEQRAVQRRDQLVRVLLAQGFGLHVFVEQELQPI